MEDFSLNNGSGNLTYEGFRRNSAHMLPVTDWLCDIPENLSQTDLVEVQFKNTRKGYYANTNHLPLRKGDMVAVDANPGHDIGEVTLTGALVKKQMAKYRIDLSRYEIRSVYRLATQQDLDRREEAKAKEQDTMIKARQLAKSLGLEMKIGDVEYQGDGAKAIFYYIADGRVDFRQLIKVYAEQFRVRIEMKQIGARQEAGRIGGTGPCGRELCCSTWMTNFHSVGTGAARLQNISLNPQKLAGQCAKLKCCLNYEVDVYEEATAKLPSREVVLHTKDCDYFYFSADPLAGHITYSTDPRIPANLQVLTPEQAKAIIEMNERGEKPLSLGGKQTTAEVVEIGYQSGSQDDDISRFDKRKKGGRGGHNDHNRGSRNDRRGDRQERVEKGDYNTKNERFERTDRSDRGERGEHNNRRNNESHHSHNRHRDGGIQQH
ncbi:MAG: hypothetical protein MJZ89_00280 [Paludibacteraceae bacterium]|nr:hypothetical protein [Paludibacteraceae bacterium]